MKQYDTRWQAREENLKYKRSMEESPGFWNNYDKKWEIGDHVLIQHFTDWEEGKGSMVSRPVLGIFVGYSVWDQALVVNIIEKPRAWMRYCEVKNSKDSEYYTNYTCLDPQVESMELWIGDIKVLGYWKYKPSHTELINALDPERNREVKEKYVKIQY